MKSGESCKGLEACEHAENLHPREQEERPWRCTEVSSPGSFSSNLAIANRICSQIPNLWIIPSQENDCSRKGKQQGVKKTPNKHPHPPQKKNPLTNPPFFLPSLEGSLRPALRRALDPDTHQHTHDPHTLLTVHNAVLFSFVQKQI